MKSKNSWRNLQGFVDARIDTKRSLYWKLATMPRDDIVDVYLPLYREELIGVPKDKIIEIVLGEL